MAFSDSTPSKVVSTNVILTSLNETLNSSKKPNPLLKVFTKQYDEHPESPSISGGKVKVMGSKAHNCGVNALLAGFFGKTVTQELNPFQADEKVTWIFRLFLAEHLPKHGNLGGLSVEDWRRSLTMLYEGPLFNPEEFEGGKRGEGLNMSIKEFKEVKDARLKDWILNNKNNQTACERQKLEGALKNYYQW